MTLKRAAWLALALSTVACGRPKDETTGSLDPARALKERQEMPLELQAQLDSGSVSFRAQALEEALRHYTAATQIDDGVAAAWFGVYMAQKALGNTAEALTALEKVQALAPGASLVAPEGDTAS